jgi:hypothetical protein
VVGLPLGVLEGAMLPQPGEQAVAPCASVHVTPLLAGSLATVAVNCSTVFSGRSALTGAAETLTAETITVVKLDTALLKTEVAVMVIVKSLAGGVGGAV